MWSQLEAALLAQGWKSDTPQPPAVASAALERADGCRLVIEQRPSGSAAFAFWLWVLEGRQARAFGLPLTDANWDAVVAELRAHQDAVTTGNYFTAYLALQKVCEVSIMAWEQFEGGPPFGSGASTATPRSTATPEASPATPEASTATPEASTATSGWGNPERSDPGKKGW